MKKAPCEHPRQMPGPEVPRQYGTWKTWVCVKCGKWRTTDHYNLQPGEWRPFKELFEATTWSDD